MPDQSRPERPPLLTLTFADGSVFTLPMEWEDVFVDAFGPNPAAYPAVVERLQWLVERYVAHQAWPSKFDGLLIDEDDLDALGDARYNRDDYYAESWADWGPEGRGWADGTITAPPTRAQVAEAVLYQTLRTGLLQKALQQYAEATGTPVVRVITPQQFLRELRENGESADSDDQAKRTP